MWVQGRPDWIRSRVIRPGHQSLAKIAHFVSILDKCCRPHLGCFCIRNSKNMPAVHTDARKQYLLLTKRKQHPLAKGCCFLLRPCAQERTWTSTPCGISTSRIRVYQFHHLGIDLSISYNDSPIIRNIASIFKRLRVRLGSSWFWYIFCNKTNDSVFAYFNCITEWPWALVTCPCRASVWLIWLRNHSIKSSLAEANMV